MTEETKLKAPLLAKASSDKVFCYLSMALFLALPIVEIITEVLGKNKIKVIGPRPPYPSYFQPYVVAFFGALLALAVILNFVSRIVNGKFKLYVADVFFFTLFIFTFAPLAAWLQHSPPQPSPPGVTYWKHAMTCPASMSGSAALSLKNTLT